MSDIIDYFVSSHGICFINVIACGVFITIIWVSISNGSIYFGYAVPRIRKSKNPLTFWLIILVFVVVAGWTGLTVLLNIF